MYNRINLENISNNYNSWILKNNVTVSYKKETIWFIGVDVCSE